MICSGFSDYPDGWFLADKAEGWTSFDVVNKLRRGLRVKKAGHAGTLDPAATGLLIIATGKYTKRIAEFQDLDKVYTGIIRLGEVSATFDREGTITSGQSPELISTETILNAVQTHFTGSISQVPPVFSAIKQKGRKLYELARKGIDVKPEPRAVTIHSFSAERLTSTDVSFEIKCSKGTYIRSIANDLGSVLGCGGYLYSLRRTAIGPVTIHQAQPVEDLIRTFRPEDQILQVAGD